jgi:hypothetical protein
MTHDGILLPVTESHFGRRANKLLAPAGEKGPLPELRAGLCSRTAAQKYRIA